MTQQRQPAHPPEDPPLGVLSQRVRDARAAVHEHRQGPVNSTDAVNARHRLLLALEAYIAALESRRLPVPHPLRAERELNRRLFSR
jgi:hypothetical protein